MHDAVTKNRLCSRIRRAMAARIDYVVFSCPLRGGDRCSGCITGGLLALDARRLISPSYMRDFLMNWRSRVTPVTRGRDNHPTQPCLGPR